MATKPTPNEQLVQVFDTKEESEALIVNGLLESSGIPALMSSLEAPQDVLPGVGGIVIRVPETLAADALQLIADFRRGGDTRIEETVLSAGETQAPED